jgi:hypothetical protein
MRHFANQRFYRQPKGTGKGKGKAAEIPDDTGDFGSAANDNSDNEQAQ